MPRRSHGAREGGALALPILDPDGPEAEESGNGPRILARDLCDQGPTIDPISPAGRVLRVHLRPFLAAGGDATDLLDAFVRTPTVSVGPPSG